MLNFKKSFFMALPCLVSFVSMFDKASADLIYNFVQHELVAENGSGETVFVTGGELVLVDGADDDGILQSSEVISATVHTSLISNLTANVLEGSLFGFGTFSNGQLIGGYMMVDEDDLDDTFVDWGGGDKISFGNDDEYFSKDVDPGNFVIATRAVPEPATMSVFGSMIFVALTMRRRKRKGAA